MDLVVGPWGARPTVPEAADGAGPEPDAHHACEHCGAVLRYAPGTEALACGYCGNRTRIAARAEIVEEQDLDDALTALGDAPPPEDAIAVDCTGCGASFTFEPHRHAGPCPFCGQSMVAAPGGPIPPTALLPFLVGEDQARERITGWLRTLWFAPTRLADEARGRDSLHGVYLPCFTFDSRTETAFQGQRGDVYHETRYVPMVVNGRRTMQAKPVPKVRWQRVAGRVARVFDDVAVTATKTLPESLLGRIGRFDTERARPFEPAFLAGFESQRRQITLADALERARVAMRQVIERDVKARIGGDMQRITSLDIRHADRRYKLVLVPVWHGELRFAGRVHRVLVNGRSGAVVGERPYSAAKIAAAALAATAVVLVVVSVIAILPDGPWLR